jgi:CelD/BcsL family acetyltransferase involved in cellulose biosynthesis
VVGATALIDCDRPFDALHATLSKNLRGNLRTAKNRLAPVADVRFAESDAAPDLLRAFDDFVEVEASGWKGASGTRSAVALRASQLAFHREIMNTLVRPNRCEVSGLYAEGRCIASQFCVQTGAELAVLKMGFDERYARCSPGQLLFERAVQRYCADDSIKRVNMLGDAAWIAVWKPEVVPTRSAYIGLGRWTGPLLVRLQRLRIEHGPRAKRLLQRLRSR